MRIRFLVAAAVGAVVAALVLIGCSSDDKDSADHSSHSGQSSAQASPTAAQPADHNDVDVTFAQQMIMHHQQAIDMSKLVEGRSTTPEVEELATNIQQAQQPEIDKFTEWLQQWGQPTMAAGHDMSEHMPGMVPDATLDRMKTISGKDFDKLWLESMIAHHKGAIAMASVEISGGQYQPAKQTAQDIIDNQQPEIDKMTALLGQG